MKFSFIRISLFCSFILLPLQSWGQHNLPSVCGGSRVRYGVSGLPGSTFNWEVKGGTILQTYNDSVDVQWEDTEGIKTIQVTEYTQGNCVAAPDIAYVMVSSPKVDIGNLVELCQGDMHIFETQTTFTRYSWNTGETTPTIAATKAGTYWVEVADAIGCKGRDTAEVVVNPLPMVNLGKDTTLYPDEKLTLDAGSDGTNYLWSTNEISQSIDVNAGKKTIWVEVTNQHNCSARDTVMISEFNLGEWVRRFKVPNAFTPNGDGDNDTWRISWMQYIDHVKVEIFDRWGRHVYQSNNGLPANGWDGLSGGKPLPMDSYYYIINLQDGSEPLVGTVTIIR